MIPVEEIQHIKYLLTDSRQLGNEPEATLFFALRTATNDGANYIPELYAKGVRDFVVNKEGFKVQVPRRSLL